MKNLLEKIKQLFIKFWKKVKSWILKNWFITVNYFVILLSYAGIYNKPGMSMIELLLGFWIFISCGYGIYVLFRKPLNEKSK